MRGGISEDEKKSRARAARERLRQSAPRRKRSEGCESNETGERIGFGPFQELCGLGADPEDLLAGKMVELAHEVRVSLCEHGMQDGQHCRSLLARGC